MPEVRAQAPDATSRVSLMRTADQENWFIRASTHEREALGRIAEIRHDTAVVGGHAIVIADITRVERRFSSGGGWKRGAAIAGGATAVFAAYALIFSCEYNCSPLPAAGIVGISALIGGLAGQLISPPQHSWRDVYP